MRLTFVFLLLTLFSELSLAATTKASAKAKAVAVPAKKTTAKAPAKKVTTKAPTKAPVKAPTKAPVKAPPAKAPPAKAPPAKAPPAKAPPAKAPPAKAPPAKAPPAKAPAKTASTKAPAKTPPAACALRTKPKVATKPTSAKTRQISKRAIATTQFHATCKNSVNGVKASLAAGGTLQNPRIWPNEFTWSGGFYVTPKKQDAELFGAIFLAERCRTNGGVAVMELTLDMTGLKPLEPGADALRFSIEHSKLGRAIRQQLGITGSVNTPTAFPAIADAQAAVEKIETDPAAAKVAFKGVSVKAAEQKSAIQRFKDFQGVDVVQATTPVSAGQKALAADAKQIGMKPDFPVAAFTQVILVSDKAMGQLKFKTVEDLDPCLAALQKDLLAKQAAKAAEAEADGQILQAATEGR